MNSELSMDENDIKKLMNLLAGEGDIQEDAAPWWDLAQAWAHLSRRAGRLQQARRRQEAV